MIFSLVLISSIHWKTNLNSSLKIPFGELNLIECHNKINKKSSLCYQQREPFFKKVVNDVMINSIKMQLQIKIKLI